MWFTGINYYKLVVEKDRDSIFTTITYELLRYCCAKDRCVTGAVVLSNSCKLSKKAPELSSIL